MVELRYTGVNELFRSIVASLSEERCASVVLTLSSALSPEDVEWLEDAIGVTDYQVDVSQSRCVVWAGQSWARTHQAVKLPPKTNDPLATQPLWKIAFTRLAMRMRRMSGQR